MRPSPHELYVLQEVKIPASGKTGQKWGTLCVLLLVDSALISAMPVTVEHRAAKRRFASRDSRGGCRYVDCRGNKP